MNEKPFKTIDPLIVDTQLVNNPKLMALFTDYQQVLNMFPGESLIAAANNFIRHTHDPVTAESEFYQALNSTDDENSIKLETIDNPNIDYDKLKSGEGLNKGRHTEDPTDPPETAKLKDIVDPDVQFILYWVEKFRCIHDTVKAEIWNTIPKNDTGGGYSNENTYFNNFNESMFNLCDDKYIKNRSSISYQNPLTPREPFNKNMVQKLDAETYNTANDMSSKTGLMFSSNMFRIGIDYDRDSRTTWFQDQVVYPQWHPDSMQVTVSPSPAHGNNNVADSVHPARVTKNIDAAQLKMNEILGDMKRVLDFLDKNAVNDSQQWGSYNHSVIVNQVWMRVDQSLTELREISAKIPLSTTSNQVLS